MSESGLESVFNAHRAALERFLRARCGDASEAEDLLQDLWLKLAGATGPIGEPLAYLYRMADNLVLDKRRSALRRIRREDSWNDVDGGGRFGISAAPSAERELIGRQQLDRAETALAALGDRTALIFKRFRLENVGQRQIAEDVGISLSSVEKHLQKAYRAMLDLRKEIDAENAPLERHNAVKEDHGKDY